MYEELTSVEKVEPHSTFSADAAKLFIHCLYHVYFTHVMPGKRTSVNVRKITRPCKFSFIRPLLSCFFIPREREWKIRIRGSNLSLKVKTSATQKKDESIFKKNAGVIDRHGRRTVRFVLARSTKISYRTRLLKIYFKDGTSESIIIFFSGERCFSDVSDWFQF